MYVYIYTNGKDLGCSNECGMERGKSERRDSPELDLMERVDWITASELQDLLETFEREAEREKVRVNAKEQDRASQGVHT